MDVKRVFLARPKAANHLNNFYESVFKQSHSSAAAAHYSSKAAAHGWNAALAPHSSVLASVRKSL